MKRTFTVLGMLGMGRLGRFYCSATVILAALICLTSTAAAATCDPSGADFGDIAAVRARIASNCPCADFDQMSERPNRKAYLACVNKQIVSATLNRKCVPAVKRIFKKSICGYMLGWKRVCVEHSVNGGGVKCSVKTGGTCNSTASRIRKECHQAVCLDAADTNGNQLIDDGDTGGCAPIPGVCGDGVINPGEQCDEGTAACNGGANDGMPCASNAACGGGICSLPYSPHGINGSCQHGICGNHDDLPDRCRSNCKTRSCGDGVVDTFEGCDDGNTTNGDGCSATCAVEP